jgi:hypothetical protein
MASEADKLCGEALAGRDLQPSGVPQLATLLSVAFSSGGAVFVGHGVEGRDEMRDHRRRRGRTMALEMPSMEARRVRSDARWIGLEVWPLYRTWVEPLPAVRSRYFSRVLFGTRSRAGGRL